MFVKECNVRYNTVFVVVVVYHVTIAVNGHGGYTNIYRSGKRLRSTHCRKLLLDTMHSILIVHSV